VRKTWTLTWRTGGAPGVRRVHLRLPPAGEAAQRGQPAAHGLQAPPRAGQAVHGALPPPPPRRAGQAARRLRGRPAEDCLKLLWLLVHG